jgi:hypothetical protein
MESTMTQKHSLRLLTEMSEFATFTAAEQRFVRRSLDVGLSRNDAFIRWARNTEEVATIRAQAKRYRTLDFIRGCIPDDLEIDALESCVGPLFTLAASDLAEGKIGSFAAFRFLYERLVGPAIRPWLPSVFCAAAALPSLHPDQRKLLLQSIKGHEAAAPGWSSLAPLFYPEWVEKVQEAVNSSSNQPPP